jgi:superfamily I DNA/RNA helicase
MELDQTESRRRYLRAILDSPSERKMIVAGPGTGKTFTMGQILRGSVPGTMLALTFIRNLVNDMQEEFGDIAEAKTFHAYCKMLLHQLHGSVDLAPYLTKVIEEDATAMQSGLLHFSDAFQLLQVDSPQISYYLARGDYYRAVSFDDSVFRVLEAVDQHRLELPTYDQIVIDEYQDFNPLEVNFIQLLQDQGPILIVGDDDQAVYTMRNASPRYLRALHSSGAYDIFELPYCTRCTQAIVESANHLVTSAIQDGAFSARIDRPFEAYQVGKEIDNAQFPKIITAQMANIPGMTGYIRRAIDRVPPEHAVEARSESYPCVLIVGQRQYLNYIHKTLSADYPGMSFSQAEDISYSLEDGYHLLLSDPESNLGWRVLAGCELPPTQLTTVINSTQDGSPLIDLLPEEFVTRHNSVLGVLRAQEIGEEETQQLVTLLGESADAIIEEFFPVISQPEEEAFAEENITVLVSSFQGCKGLSAAHVFVVGMNDGDVPTIGDGGTIADIEYSKFLVAITRARKSVTLLSCKWDYRPQEPEAAKSRFIDMLPDEYRQDAGYLLADQVSEFLDQFWPVAH